MPYNVTDLIYFASATATLPGHRGGVFAYRIVLLGTGSFFERIKHLKDISSMVAKFNFEALCCVSNVEILNYDIVSFNILKSRFMVQSEINFSKTYSSFCTLFILI